jgi:hypothetical protein
MKIIIYTNTTGNVSVTTPTGEISIEEVLSKDCPDHAIIVDDSELPKEHNDFFNAWEIVNSKVTVNIDKAKDITKDRLRAERKPKLEALDVEQMKVLGDQDAINAIDGLKQQLRDAPAQVDNLTTVEELKAVTLPDVGV